MTSITADDVLVFKHQATSIHNVDSILLWQLCFISNGYTMFEYTLDLNVKLKKWNTQSS